MTNHLAPSIKSTSSTFRPRVRRLGEGRYLVESQTKPGTGHPVSASSCNCPSFHYRGRCRHVELVRAIEPRMQQWYSQATKVVSVALGLDELDAAQAQLASALRALADTHEQSDERAVYLRQVDQAERAVAALEYSAMRGA